MKVMDSGYISTTYSSGSESIVMTVRIDGATYSENLSLERVQGDTAPNVQFMQDMEGTIFYTVFGPKLSTMRFMCSDPNRMCVDGEITGGPTVITDLQNKIKIRELPIVSMVYRNTMFRGYLSAIELDTNREHPLFTMVVVGTVV